MFQKPGFSRNVPMAGKMDCVPGKRFQFGASLNCSSAGSGQQRRCSQSAESFQSDKRI